MNFIQKNGSAKTLKEINLRKGEPSTNGSPTKISVGTVLRFIGWVTDGESVSGNSKWFKTAEGNYFWAGNVEEVPDSPPLDRTTSPTSSMQFLVCPIQANDENGKLVTPRTVRISSILDHQGTSIEENSKLPPFSWGLRGKDKKVKAFNGEIGNGESTSGDSALGYANKQPNPFFSKREINYVGAGSGISGYPANHYLNYDGHPGYDFSYQTGTPIVAPADGYLSKIEKDPVSGPRNSVSWDVYHTFCIKHTNGFSTWFLHCRELRKEIEAEILSDFQKSVFVKQGELVAYSGKQGTPAQHLHFEVRGSSGKVVDPYSDNLWEDS